MIKGKKNSNVIDEPRINDEIVGYDKVRLIYRSDEGENKSVVISIDEARRRADKDGKDLIEINSKTDPPILKIEDYSKYLWRVKLPALRKRHSQIE